MERLERSLLKEPIGPDRRRSCILAWVLLFLVLRLLSPAASAATTETQAGTPAERTAGQNPEATQTQDLDDVHSVLFRANQAYLEGQYAEARDLYESLVDRGLLNGHVFFNLGNTYVRLGRIGEAILNYSRASLLQPRDGDLEANLQYARSLTQDRIEGGAPSLWHTMAFWVFGTNLRELLTAFVLLNALFWCSAVFNLYRQSEWAKWWFWLSLLLSLAAGISAGVKYRQTFWNAGGVLLAEESPVRAGFSRNDTTLFVLHEGAEFTILDEEKDWWKIALADGKKGWVPREAAGQVALSRDHPRAR
jgi:tetratricopeptide (TPR) repeat protein